MPIKINNKNKSPRVEIVRVGNFKRRFEDDLKINRLDLEKMKQNFDDNARRQEFEGRPVLPFNFSHEMWGKAAGWITSLEIGKDSKNFDALFASVEWTERGAKKIREKEFKFVSSEFTRDFKDPETNKIFDIILGGAALTNIPFIRDMEAVQLSEGKNGHRTVVSLSLELSGDNPGITLNKNVNMLELTIKFDSLSPEDKEIFLSECKLKGVGDDKKLSEELEKSKKDLELSEKNLTELKAKTGNSGELADEFKLSEQKRVELEEKVSSLIQTAAKDQRTVEFNTMLSEGKVCEAQRKPFETGDMADFAAKQQPVKLHEKGSHTSGDMKLQESENKVEKLTNELSKKDGISYGDAMKQVLSENSELRTILGH